MIDETLFTLLLALLLIFCSPPTGNDAKRSSDNLNELVERYLAVDQGTIGPIENYKTQQFRIS